jgi:hypothetical protein
MLAGVRERVSARTIVAAAAIVAAAGLAGITDSFTWPALIVTLAGAAFVLTVALHAPRSSRGDRDALPRGYGAWAVVAIAALGWQLAAYVQSPRAEHPTLSSMLDAADAHAPLRAMVFLAWVVLGLALARR